MEKEIYTEQNLPFAGSELIRTAQYIKNKKRTGYDGRGFDADLTNNLFSKFLEKTEEFSGPFYSPEGGFDDPIPKEWHSTLAYLNDNKIISSISFPELYCDMPKMVRVSVYTHPEFSLMDTDGYLPPGGLSVNGSSSNPEEAISKAIGEAIERYVFLIYKRNKLLKSSINDLIIERKRFLSPKRLFQFSDVQKKLFPRYNFNNESVFCWSEAKSLINGREVLIPSQLVFWNYANGRKEPFLRESNTNGAGGHFTLTKAILSGLYELIQRDGLFIYWLNSLSPARIKNESIKYEPTRKLLEELKELGFEVFFLNITTDLEIPSCICIVVDYSGIGPKVSMGGGGELNWNESLYRSLLEAVSVSHLLRYRKDENGEDYECIENVDNPSEKVLINQRRRLNAWGDEKMFDHIKFFISGKEINLEELTKNEIKFSSPEKELAYLVSKFKKMGKDYEPFYYQAKHKVLDDLNYFAVKVIVPALVPLYLTETFAPLGAKRLKEVPPKLGYKPAEEWNPWPHPFP